MQNSYSIRSRAHTQTYLFVGICWLFPVAIVSLTAGPVQWINYWALKNHWSANFRWIGLGLLAALLFVTILILTRQTTRFLINDKDHNSPMYKGVWIFLTLSCITSLSWLVFKPELINAISQSLAYIPLH